VIKSAGKIGLALSDMLCFFSSLQRAPVLEAWVGLRPGRPCTRIEKEVMKFKDKLGRERSLKVVHNYGHGGSGLTVHWGCAADTADLVFQFLAQGQMAKL